MAPLMGNHPLNLRNKVLGVMGLGCFTAAWGMGSEQQKETVFIAASSRH